MLADVLPLVLLLHPNSPPSSDQPQEGLPLPEDTPGSGMGEAPTVELGCQLLPLAALADGSG